MNEWIVILLPFTLLLGRTAAFIGVLPIFGSMSIPMRVRAGVALSVTVFFAVITPLPDLAPGQFHWLSSSMLLIAEILAGIAMGLAVRLVYMAVQQGGQIAGRQLGFADAGVIDPVTSERTRPLAMFFQVTFALFFLAGNGHHLLLRVIARSYRIFPVSKPPEIASLAGGLVTAGSTMLLFALKLSAPLLAAFLVLAVVLAILARVLPEMNILLTSFPLRIGLGLLMAAQLVPIMGAFTDELAGWINRFLIS